MPRKEKRYHFIYKTTNILSGKYYYGMHSTDDLNDGYLGSGKRLRYSINKHGKKNHTVEILEFCNSREELGKRESEIVNLNELAKTSCMNLRVGGLGGERPPTKRVPWNKGHKGVTKLKLSEKQLEQRRESQKKIWQGRKHSEESKKKMRESHLGQIPVNKRIPMNEETRKKCSEGMSGENHPNFGKSWSGMKGKTHSEETKKKMSKSQTGKNNAFYGKKHSKETIEKLRKSAKKRKNLSRN